ncbi:MAG: hypothetical protein ACFFA0_05195 [Promethearchaeota archaeon]
MVPMPKIRYILFVIVFSFLCFLPWTTFQPTPESRVFPFQEENLEGASEDNYDNINSIFTRKIADYNAYGFFPQLYEPSLQATYYGLYILDVLGKLEQVNETQIIDYIMNTYNSSSHLFMDKYTHRYLDTDFTKQFRYPLTSLLQIHCYGILSLDLLNALDLIDLEESKEFIWSCYNNLTSGFIGEPFDLSSDYYAKISTIDNTYYAVKTLDLLMDNWMEYSQERSELIAHINSLQVSDNLNWDFGGFIDDNESYYTSIVSHSDVSIFSSYYCIKTLEIFGMEGTINPANFYQFLEELYDVNGNYFQIMGGIEEPYANIVATALALDLSAITGFASYNESGTIEFVFNNRNSLGIWDGSTVIEYHELIDTFQILRAISDTGLMSMLTLVDTTQITESILGYFLVYPSFTLISKDYTTLNLLHTIISSFDLYERLPDLDFQDLYQEISNAYHWEEKVHGFWAITRLGYEYDSVEKFRSCPIEFHTLGRKENLKDINYFISHKYTFYALNSLKTLFKLDDFELTHNLNKLLTDILKTQFLNDSYSEFYGAFSYIYPYEEVSPEIIIKGIYFEYTYYAIKALEVLSEHLNIGDLTFLDLDQSALLSYINNHIVETSDQLYFNPHYTNNIETLLENTYYMIYVLKALDIFDLDIEKIINFLEYHLNYSNIKNGYYCYMLGELLEYDFEFNNALIQELVGEIFYEPIYEYFLTSDRNELNQEIFLWICEMAKTDSFIIEALYPQESVMGKDITITASLHNIILSSFGSNLTFMLESTQLGNHEFKQTNPNNFSLTVSISHDSNNYPEINGKILAYVSSTKLAELSISIITYYPKGEYNNIYNGTLVLSVLFITIPGGIIIFSERKLRKLKLKI